MPPNLWNIFSPFSVDLWLAIAICVVIGSVMMTILKRIWTAKPVYIRTVTSAFYNTLAAFLGGDEYEHLTPPGKFYRLGNLFFVLICSATYTANLAAFLTKPSYMVHGPSTLAAMKSSKICWPSMVFDPTLASFLQREYGQGITGPPLSRMRTMPHTTDYRTWMTDWCEQELQAGRVDVVVETEGFIRPYQLKKCSTTSVVPDIRFSPRTFNIDMHSNATQAMWQLNAALYHVTATAWYVETLKK